MRWKRTPPALFSPSSNSLRTTVISLSRSALETREFTMRSASMAIAHSRFSGGGETGEDRSEGQAPAPGHSDCDSAGGESFIRDRNIRRPDRGEHGRRHVAKRAPQERRRLDLRRQEQERRAQQIRDRRHAEERGPEVQRQLRSNASPAPMPASAASGTDSRKGSAFVATTLAAATAAAATIARSRR